LSLCWPLDIKQHSVWVARSFRKQAFEVPVKFVILSLFVTLLPATNAVTQQAVPAQTQESPVHHPLKLSQDTNRAEIRFGNDVYSIPRNYLAGVTQPSATNEYAAFTIQVLLPDFVPRTPQNTEQFDRLGWHDQFRALFEYPRRPLKPDDHLASYLHHYGKDFDDFRLVGSGYKLYEIPRMAPQEIFTKVTSWGLLFVICDMINSVPSPSCTVNEPFGDGVGVIYHFSRQYIDQAADIDKQLHTLLSTFIAK
jgi:hypothetical protein